MGGIIPSPESPAIRAKSQSPITITPAEAKKSGACRDFENSIELTERRARIGSVPMENASIMSDPERNDPLAKAATCID